MNKLYGVSGEILKMLVPTLILIGTIVITLRVTRPTNFYSHLAVVLIIIYTFMFFVYKQRQIKQYAITALYITGFMLVMRWLAGYGILGLIIIVLGYAAYRIIKDVRRKDSIYMKGMRSIETQVFGKPLDKKLWKEENKNVK